MHAFYKGSKEARYKCVHSLVFIGIHCAFIGIYCAFIGEKALKTIVDSIKRKEKPKSAAVWMKLRHHCQDSHQSISLFFFQSSSSF
jgi:hypothetical protein